MVVRLSSYVEIKAGVSLHPSHTPIINLLEENEEEILKDIKSPQVGSFTKTTVESIAQWGWAALHIGIVCASHPAAPGSNPGTAKIFLNCLDPGQ